MEESQKRIAAEKKKDLQAVTAKGMSAMEGALEEAIARGDRFLILDVQLGVDSKAVKQAVNMLKKKSATTAVLCLSEEEQGSGGKVVCFAYVPEEGVQAGLSANSWINAALEVCGGRGGGKADAAQGQAGSADTAALEAAKTAAKAMAESCF